MKIRDGTKDEELIGVKREFVYKMRNNGFTNTCPSILSPVYYDFAILELGNIVIYFILYET